MATLVDLEEHEDNQPEELFEEGRQDEPVDVEDDNQKETESDSEVDLPEKYQGKTASELAEMHANLEKVLGRQSEELGEIRKAFDALAQERMTEKQSAPEPEVDEADFWADPNKAIKDAISNHPKVKEAEKISVEMARRASIEALASKHPDMKDILTNDSFKEWVKSSKVRTRLYNEADQNYDFDAADELLSLWKERQSFTEKQQKVEKAARKQEVKKASTGSSRSNPDGRPNKKVFRRRDIIELMNRDPKRYEALQDEILLAYAEGRVK